MQKLKKILTLTMISLVLVFVSANQCLAQKQFVENPIGTNPSGAVSVSDITAMIIKGILGLVGILSLIFFIYGGVLWMTAMGNTEGVEKGKKTLYWATAGLAAIFASYAVLNLIIDAVTEGVIQ
jgi:hypothetical protein